MKIKIILALAMAILCYGCCSTPKVESTKPWEGHYMTVDDFKQSTNVIDLVNFAISILFAVSFQPLMQLAAFPVILFGAVSFFNHGLRAFFSMLAGKLPFSVHQMRVPLYFLYIILIKDVIYFEFFLDKFNRKS